MSNKNIEIIRAVYVHLESFSKELSETSVEKINDDYLQYLAEELGEAADMLYGVIGNK